MKLTINKNELSKTLNLVSRVVPLKPSLAVLTNFYLELTKTHLLVAATNLETSIVFKVPAKIDQVGRTTVPARILADFVNTSKEETLELVIEKENLLVKGTKSNVSLATIDAAEFPKLPEAPKERFISIEAEEILRAIHQVTFAASTDLARPVLGGVLLRANEEGLLLVATDGYRLSLYQTKIKSELPDLIVPARSLTEVAKLISETESPEIKLAYVDSNNQVIFTGTGFEISTRVLEGNFPNYEQIIPAKYVCETEVKREELIDTIRQTSVLARDLGSVVQFNLAPAKGVELVAKTAQIGEAKANVEAKVSGEKLLVGFNSRFVLEGLAALKSETVYFNFSGATSPAILKDEKLKEFTYIIMPVRIQT